MQKFLAAAIAAAALWATQAEAHVVADPNQGEAGSYFRTALRVGHGCAGKPTTAVQVTLPEGVTARAESKPGWKAEVTPRAITWRGGPLPDTEFAEFGLLMKLPAAGDTLWLPVVQSCDGGEMRWTAIPKEGESWGSLQTPAPFVRLIASTKVVAVRLGNLTISQPTARPTLGPAKSSAAFFTVANGGGEPDRLLKAESGIAETVELHTHTQDGEVMKMRPVTDVPVPANGSVVFASGGYHVMLIGVKNPLKAGDRFPLTLTFEKAGKVEIIVDVKPIGGASTTHEGHAH